jgi:hypothetical protein
MKDAKPITQDMNKLLLIYHLALPEDRLDEEFMAVLRRLIVQAAKTERRAA